MATNEHKARRWAAWGIVGGILAAAGTMFEVPAAFLAAIPTAVCAWYLLLVMLGQVADVIRGDGKPKS
jgi:hypothetical protein